MPSVPNLDFLFRPASVAVAFASDTAAGIGRTLVANLLSAHYRGTIWPVNPNSSEILGLRAAPRIQDLPLGVELGLVCASPDEAVEAVEALGRRQVKACVVFTDGCAGHGWSGHAIRERLVQAAAVHRMALLGPGAAGVAAPGVGLHAGLGRALLAKGRIAFFSQSGPLASAALDWAREHGLGFSKAVCLGDKAVISENHLLEYLQNDPETDVIAGHLESIAQGGAFLRIARQVCREKPVLLLKGGGSEPGSRAVSSYAGILAGGSRACAAAFEQCGVIQARSLAELFDLARTFASQPAPSGPGLGVLTDAGGGGVLAADAARAAGIGLPRPETRTIEALNGLAPSFASVYNPVVAGGGVEPGWLGKAAGLMLDDEHLDMLLAVLLPQTEEAGQDTARALAAQAARTGKPVLACLSGGTAVQAGRDILQEAGVPCFEFPEAAAGAAGRLWERRRLLDRPWAAEVCFRRDLGRAGRVISQARELGVNVLPEFMARELARAYELDLPETSLARTSDEAVKQAKKIGYPVVLKLAAPEIAHKSDVDGVAVNLGDETAVRRAFLDITSRVSRARRDVHVAGCLVQSMAPAGAKELFVGFERDEQFGPLLRFGLGGVYKESLGDESFRLAPLTLQDAAEMIREIRSYPLLKGLGGGAPVDFRLLEDVLLTMSQMAMDFPEIVEVQLNPLLASGESALAADVRVSLDGKEKITQQTQTSHAQQRRKP
jgi:acetyltransferase